MTREVSTAVAATRLGVSPSTVLNWLRAERLAGRRGSQPVRARWHVIVGEDGHPLAPDGTPFQSPGSSDVGVESEPRSDRARVERSERAGTAREVALRLKAAGERQRRALELQAQAINELAAALDEQGEAIAQLLLPDTVEQLTAASDRSPRP